MHHYVNNIPVRDEHITSYHNWYSKTHSRHPSLYMKSTGVWIQLRQHHLMSCKINVCHHVRGPIFKLNIEPTTTIKIVKNIRLWNNVKSCIVSICDQTQMHHQENSRIQRTLPYTCQSILQYWVWAEFLPCLVAIIEFQALCNRLGSICTGYYSFG